MSPFQFGLISAVVRVVTASVGRSFASLKLVLGSIGAHVSETWLARAFLS